jgi:hydroxymethylbilane synthase
LTTKGDVNADRSLAAIGGDGVFVAELMQALLDERADVAVHSAKDLPTALPAELAPAAILQREDARDALISREAIYPSIETLEPGSIVGTSSLRRAAQLRLLRKDLTIAPLRGNIDTRIDKVVRGDYDAAIIALAGPLRLGNTSRNSVCVRPLPLEVMVPAVGQGALYVQSRAKDHAVRDLLEVINHVESAFALGLERMFLARLGGGCLAPIGAHVTIDSDRWQLHAVIAATDGTLAVRRSVVGSRLDAAEAKAVVEGLASDMLAAGGQEIITSARRDDKQ